MLKGEQNCSYNGGEDAKPLKTWSDFLSIQYIAPLRESILFHFLVKSVRGVSQRGWQLSYYNIGRND